MAFIDLSEIAERELVPGFRVRFVHTDHVTISHWEVAAGSVLPEHAHPHEQITNVISWKFELTIDGECQVLEPGKVGVIPGNARHTGRALTDCRIIEVFYPVREDYR